MGFIKQKMNIWESEIFNTDLLKRKAKSYSLSPDLLKKINETHSLSEKKSYILTHFSKNLKF